MKINKKILFLIMIMIIETIFLKTFMYDFFPKKYFYDANRILGIMNGMFSEDKAYSYTAKIFNCVNFLGLKTLKQWGYLISLIFIPIFIKNILKEEKNSLSMLVFILASFTLLNIYVFGLSKDIIQFVYFLILYLILSNKKINNYKKTFLLCSVLLVEALLFRVYYAIMGMLIVTIFLIYKIFINGKKIKRKQLIKIIILSMGLFFAEVYVVQLLSTDNYNSILNARYSVNVFRDGSQDARTIINDLLGQNTNFLKFVGNYLINFVRLLFPFELLVKGFAQIIFMIYQLFITIMFFKSIKKINEQNCLWIITMLSYVMISTIFEPDFGSFVRHETAMILIILEIIRIGKKNDIMLNTKMRSDINE